MENEDVKRSMCRARIWRSRKLIPAGGFANCCQLLDPEITNTIEARNNCDGAPVALGGTFPILMGDNYDRVIEAKFRDAIWLTKGAV